HAESRAWHARVAVHLDARGLSLETAAKRNHRRCLARKFPRSHVRHSPRQITLPHGGVSRGHDRIELDGARPEPDVHDALLAVLYDDARVAGGVAKQSGPQPVGIRSYGRNGVAAASVGLSRETRPDDRYCGAREGRTR